MHKQNAKKLKGLNILFNIIIIMLITFLCLLVLGSISNILIRGFAGLKASLLSPEILFSIRLSFYTSIISTALCLIFAVPIAYGLERYKFPGSSIVSTIINIPMALPPIVSGVALLLLFGTTSFGKTLAAYGLKFVFNPKGIILAQFFVNISYTIRILQSTFADINPKYEFVGRTLGCSRMQAFFKITLPLAKNGLIAGTVITWARALGEFGAALMLAGSTRFKTETLPISLFLNMSTGDLPLAMAAATILIMVSIISLFIFETVGGNKNIICRKN